MFISSSSNMAEITEIPSIPVFKTSLKLALFMPPIATEGIDILFFIFDNPSMPIISLHLSYYL